MSKRPLTYGCLLLCIWIVIVHMTGGQDELSPSDITDGTILELEGEIQSLEETPENQVFYLKNNSMVQGLVQVYLRKSETKQEFQIGNRVRIRGKAALFRHATNPGQFDEAEYQTLRGIAFCVKNAEILGKDSHTAIVRESLRRLRECVRASLMRIAEEKDAGVVSAMLLGEKSGLAPELKKMYQKGGISHVLAISGLHISLLGMLLYNLLRKAGLSFGQAGIVGFLCMALYGVLTGAGVATVRAVLMFGVYLGAQYLGRTYDLLSGLAFAVICILIDNPRYLFYAGFQLSALAVLGLGTVYPKLKKCFPVKKKVGGRAVSGIVGADNAASRYGILVL